MISSPSNVTILRSKELLPDLPYPPLHQPQWLASKTIATVAALVAGPEQAKTTILRLTKKPFTPSQCTSCHPLLQKISLHSALKEHYRCGRVAGCCSLEERGGGTEEGRDQWWLSLCRRPFEAKQRRHYRRVDATPTGFQQPGSSALSRELSSISSSSCNTAQFLRLSTCVFTCVSDF